MGKLARSLLRTGVSMLVGLAAMRPAAAADLALVVVPQGMILETQVARRSHVAAPAGTTIDFVVTHDLRVGEYVVIAAGSHGVAHLVRTGHGRGSATTAHIGYDYVLASDGTRIPVTGSVPYLTTGASRTIVIYDVADADRQTAAVPLADRTEAPLTQP